MLWLHPSPAPAHLDIDQFHTEVGSCFGPGDQPNEGQNGVQPVPSWWVFLPPI